MSFWTRITGNQLRVAVRIKFYGNEDAASVELVPEPTNDSARILHITLFLSYYVRTACDLQPEYFEALRTCMDIAGKNITAFGLDLLPVEKLSILDSQMHLQQAMSFGITRTHTCELYEKEGGTLFPQSKWSPSEINKYGPISVIYYYQSLIEQLPRGSQNFLVARIANIHNYFLITGGKPNITQINEAVKYALLS